MKTQEAAIKILKKEVKTLPARALILGSGWNGVVKQMNIETELKYSEIFGVEASVPGHEGKLVIGTLGDARIVCMVGRMHVYEGYSGAEVTMTIAVLNALGVKQLVVTAASGALNPRYHVGDLVVTNDLLTLFLQENPLKGPKFLDMSEPFDPVMREVAVKVLVERELSFWEGVYAYMPGPHFETYADKRALALLGADVVGMSTVPETLAARLLEMRVLSLALVTNLAFVEHRHEDVVAAAEKQEAELVEVLSLIVERLGGYE